jgi:gluconokinase
MVVIVMGVAGVGKTTIGRALAKALGWRFVDADDYHSPANVEKMRAGVPLTDADRAPWLEALRGLISGALPRGESLVLACSALRGAYRERLSVDPARERWVFLQAPRELIAQRLGTRVGHFIQPSLLDSQLATLEVPADALTVDATRPPEEVVAAIRAGLGL